MSKQKLDGSGIARPPVDQHRLGPSERMGAIDPRELLRQKGTPYAELDLGNPKWTDDQLIDFIMEHPILINRPIVVTPLGVKLCRPSEAVLDILPNPDVGMFTKEDGEVVPTKKRAR